MKYSFLSTMEGNKTKHDLTLKQLLNSKDVNKVEQIKCSLKYIILEGEGYEMDLLSSIIFLLKDEDEEIKTLCAQVIAELSKCEEKRENYAKDEIISELLKSLQLPIVMTNLELQRQTCRALGNICCDNAAGRECIVNLKGVPTIVSFLDRAIATSPKLNCWKLCLFACKLLSNFMLGGMEYVKQCVNCQIADIFSRMLASAPHAPDLTEWSSTALLVLTVITEQLPEYMFSDELNLLFVDVLKSTKDLETSELCLELLHAQAEHDHIKLVYAKANVVQLLWSRLQDRSEELSKIDVQEDDDIKALMKIACDIIVLILTGDESMSVLYDSGNGEVYKNLVKWLNSSDVDLLTTAVLAIGNFARTDKHCVRMMEEGVFDKLFDILTKYDSSSAAAAEGSADDGCDARLQHAVLSTVRNMVVPHHNKRIAVEKGRAVVTLLAALPKANHPQVVFKLIAAIRMLVDGQESVAEELANNTDALKAVVRWGSYAEHAGPSGEAPRLFAWTVKQLSKKNDMNKLIQVDGCVACIVNMLAAPHTIMQNEAIVAISKLLVALSPPNQENNAAEGDLIPKLIQGEIGKYVNILLESNSTKSEPEMLENIVTFVQLIVKDKSLREHLSASKTGITVQKFKDSREDLTDRLKTALQGIYRTIEDLK